MVKQIWNKITKYQNSSIKITDRIYPFQKNLKMPHAKFWNKNTNVITIYQNLYTNKIQVKIAKYAKDHGPNQAARCFQSKYPTIRDSKVRSFLKKYNEQVKKVPQIFTVLLNHKKVQVRSTGQSTWVCPFKCFLYYL